MKIILLTLIVACTSLGQSAKEGRQITSWTFLIEAQAEEQSIKVYYAPETIRRASTSTQVWMRVDFPNGGNRFFPLWQGDIIGSFRGYLTLGCEANTLGGGSIILYSENDHVLLEKKIKETHPERPSSLGLVLLESFCERQLYTPTAPPKLKPKTPKT